MQIEPQADGEEVVSLRTGPIVVAARSSSAWGCVELHSVWPAQVVRDSLGYAKGEAVSDTRGNPRNGTSPKAVQTKIGPVPLEVRWDRQSAFEPQIMPKHSRPIEGFDEVIISLYAKRLTTREPQSPLAKFQRAWRHYPAIIHLCGPQAQSCRGVLKCALEMQHDEVVRLAESCVDGGLIPATLEHSANQRDAPEPGTPPRSALAC